MDEKTRLDKYEANRKVFKWENTAPGIKLIDRVRLKNVRFVFNKRLRNMKCYLYHMDKLGITERNLEEEFEGKILLIYTNTPKTILTKRHKCPFCFGPHENLLKHLEEAHNKTISNLVELQFQFKLYKELLRIVRETKYYFSTMFINSGCQLCDNPVLKGRELCCSIPTSFRDRARSLHILGLTAKGLDREYFATPNMGQIILAPK